MRGWIGVDLDGTLAGDGPQNIGGPIPAMLERVKRWLAEGHEVRIFTARVTHGPDEMVARAAIDRWLGEHLGHSLVVTNVKDFGMVELWDDRAITVEANTGRPLAPSSRGLS